MDKKLVEEMAKDMGIAFQISGTTMFAKVAEMLVEYGYRKIHEGAVVLTGGELEKMRQGIAAEVLAKVRTFVLDNEVGLKYLLDRTEREYGITKGEK